MKTIFWNKKTHRRIMVIPDKCQIIISAEQNHFIYLREQKIGFHMEHCDVGPLLSATFLWGRKIEKFFGIDNIELFQDKKRAFLSGEQMILTCEITGYNSVNIITDTYREGEVELGEILEPIKELPIINWKSGDKTVINVPDECIINLPKEYNFVHGCFDYFLCISHYSNFDNELEALKLVWTAPIKRVFVENKSKNLDFKITERYNIKQPLFPLMLKKGPYKITDESIIGIQLMITLHLDHKLRVVRKLTFTPIEKK